MGKLFKIPTGGRRRGRRTNPMPKMDFEKLTGIKKGDVMGLKTPSAGSVKSTLSFKDLIGW